MKGWQFFLILSIGVFITCASPNLNNTTQKEEPVVIANDSLEYEIIILDIGFTQYLNSIAQPVGYYSQEYLENRNQVFVANWNFRASNPQQYNPNIYQNVIDYQPQINYGYEVNYKLFNYFLFAQRKYKMDLGAGRANRIN